MFSERLRLARKRSGLSLRAMSSKMDNIVSAQAIGKYERAEMMPSSTVAIAIADALDVSPSYLLSPSTVSLESVEFRKLSTTKARERAAVEAEVLDHVDRYLQVEDILGIDTTEQDIPDEAPYRISSVEDAEKAAMSLRTAWNLGGSPIQNMTQLLEEHGIKVFKLDLPERVDGLSCRVHRQDADDVQVVVCTTGKTLERQRVTIAHELGHMVLDIPSAIAGEKACHRFAGAFLAPRAELIREVGRRRHDFGFAELIEIKRMFGISAAALVVRMRDLGIIKEGTLRAIFRGIGRSWRSQEPRPLKRKERPKRFRRLCLRALAEHEISDSKAAELLGLRISDIDRIMVGSAA